MQNVALLERIVEKRVRSEGSIPLTSVILLPIEQHLLPQLQSFKSIAKILAALASTGEADQRSRHLVENPLVVKLPARKREDVDARLFQIAPPLGIAHELLFARMRHVAFVL